jgi:hypothetical protein
MRRAVVSGAAGLVLLVASGLPAGATGVSGAAGAAAGAVRGGWATTTLDDVPTPGAGETTEVGFTILQHGVTPVDVDDVAVVVKDGDGGDQTWPAVQQGETGHYVAEVTFPAAGQYEWVVHQGWFGDYDLGTLHVGGGAAGSWWSRTPWALRVLLPLPILASVALFLLDRRRGQQSERPVVVAGTAGTAGT